MYLLMLFLLLFASSFNHEMRPSIVYLLPFLASRSFRARQRPANTLYSGIIMKYWRFYHMPGTPIFSAEKYSPYLASFKLKALYRASSQLFRRLKLQA